MIEKNEILKMAAGLDLNPDTVEKDYILGWMLFGINRQPAISTWAFKGGTSLKKCFFETFRFSEDLDFTVTKQSHLTEKFLLRNFIEITDFLMEEVGLIFFKDRFKFKIIDKGNGNYSAQGKIHFNGPLRRKQGVATIKLDLTTDEILVLRSVKKKVHHPYTDEPSQGIYANCYAFEEVVAEKIRALAQRARPRDVYDVVHIFRNRQMINNPTLVYNVLQKKCNYKKIEIPTFQHIEEHEKLDELEPQWEFMLAHQLSYLPSFASFWNDLSPFFDWLTGQLSENKLVSVSTKDEQIFHPGRVHYAYSANFLLQRIQFAAANRVCIKLRYKSKTRTVEPISFRTSSIGNRLFYGFEREANHAKAYSISKIQSIEITNIAYTEKYPVEISSSGRVSMPPIRRTSNVSIAKNDSRYVYECPNCERKFYRKKRNSKLNPHKDKDGLACSGRRGILIN
ncbi:MAG: nucleotidyl transferase AbiEii/AbiGii toxin family protein [Calditrichia bacterium]|jgi:predicted nucleotidyltransferase component of viral defense system|nr:nucleotidyl transferase AbiEii/AbiGii toxin family protein [Calditrichia bacterium]